ncbi:MAG: glycosyl hydrolase, partial [Kiritimatiellia bacterium]
QGVRGFYIHSRQGLRQPYLSESFFRMVKVAVECAGQHGMTVHLYDEYPYPSGAAGGEVVLGNPHFHATRLVQKTFDVSGGPVRLALPEGKVLCCVACPLQDGRARWRGRIDLRDCVGMVLMDNSYVLMGLTAYNRKRYFASHLTPILEADLPRGPHRIFVSVQAEVDRHKYWGHFVDVLNPTAIRHFLDLTHARYYKHLGGKFGKRIHSIFVDETAPHWSERLPSAFQAEYGYDLASSLPALQDAAHPDHLKVALDLRRLQYKLFCETFEKPIARWCGAHGLRYSGEKPSLRLAQLRYMDIPGCEPGHTKAGAKMDLLQPSIRGNARATASAAYFYGKEGALCECGHSLGWAATLQDLKLIAEGLLLMGIRYLVPHGFFYSTHALKKHDAPPSFFFQSPYWRLFGRLSERVERIGRYFEGTHIDAQILVVDPASGLPDEADLDAYRRLLDLLMGAHLDFLVVDTDILESGRMTGGRVHIREIAAGLVLVPPMRVIEKPLDAWLAAFEKAGGTVIRCKPAFDDERLTRRILTTAQPSLRLRAKAGDAGQVQVVARTDGRRRLWFALNTGRARVDLELDAGCPLREIPLDDNPPALATDQAGRHTRALQPFESFLLTSAERAAPTASLSRLRIPVRGAMKVTAGNRNLLRMDDWEMALLDEQGLPMQTERVSAIPLINQLAQAKFRYAPASELFFGSMPELRLPPLHARYRFSFLNAYAGPVQLVMEPGSIVGDWRICVNERGAIRPAQFRRTAAHVRGSLGVDIARFLRKGRNEIVVAVTTDRPDGGLLSPLYLAGDFGVRCEPLGLIHRRESGGFETYAPNGLPYYAGLLEYETTLHLKAVPGDRLVMGELDFGVPFEEACEVALNDEPWQAVPWTPRRFGIRSAAIRKGPNRLRLRVHTTQSRAFEGQWFDSKRHAYRDVRTS